MVPPRCVADVVAELRPNVVPLMAAAVDPDGLRAARRRGLADALVAADVRDHLVVVVVAVAALHRLDVTAVRLVEGVDEHDGRANAQELIVAGSEPLVPAGDENELRIDLE